MTRAMGFLTGVCLTLAMFVLVLDRWQHRVQEAAPENPEATQSISEGDCYVAPLLAETGQESASVIARREATKQSATSLSTQNSPCIETTHANINNQTVSDALAEEAMQSVSTSKPQNAAPLTGTESGTAETEAPAHSEAITPDADVRAVNATDEKAVPDPQPSATVQLEPPDNAAPADTDEWVSEEPDLTHIFWSPFRSEWAAKGFARRLTNATQIPIDIVATDPGQYRVAFAYRDENERQEHIERIESITGLKLE